MGLLEVTTGGMGTGKTAYLIVEYNNLVRNNLKVLTIKPKMDTRDYGIISSRILPNSDIKVDLLLGETDEVPVKEILLENYDVILVDEMQMFTEKQIKQLHYISVISETYVYMYGLMMSCTGEPFPSAMLANALADSRRTLRSINKYKDNRNYAIKYSDGAPVNINTTSLIEAGGDSLYSAVSKREFFSIYSKYIENQLLTENDSTSPNSVPTHNVKE